MEGVLIKKSTEKDTNPLKVSVDYPEDRLEWDYI